MTETFAATRIRLNAVELIQSSADPTSGAGVAAAIGSSYLRGTGTAGLYNKTGAGDAAWQKLAQSLAWYSVKDYGAIGDGATDDTAAIQAAINDCATNGGGVVFFPFGTYAVTQLTITNQDNVQLQGSGASSVVKWLWNAATVAGSMITISAGSDRTQIRNLRFDGSGLTNPNAGRDNHLVKISGACVETHVMYNEFTGMVAASGDGVHIVGTAGNLVDRIWVCENNFDGCSRFGIGGEQGFQYLWMVQNHLTNCETDIAIVNTADLAVLGVSCIGNEIVHTGTTRHAMRFEGGSTTFITALMVAENVVLGGFATVQRAHQVSWNGNVITSGAFASTDGILRVFGNVQDAIISENVIDHASGSSSGPCIKIEKSTDSPNRLIVANNVLVQEKAGANFITVVDATKLSIHLNLCHTTDAGATSMHGIDVQAVTLAMTDTKVGPGNQFSSDANLMASAIRVLANGANVTNVMVCGNSGTSIDYGIRWEVGGGGGAFSGIIFAPGNNFDGTTGLFNNVGVTVKPRIGFNASTTGQNLFSGAGTPESAITATVGSWYLRTDGGQGTAAYYKESGSGSTGWIGIGGTPMVFGAGSVSTGATALFMAPGWVTTASTTELQLTATRPGTVRNLYIEQKTAGVTTETNTYTVRKNGVDTALTTTKANDATGAASDTTHSFTVAAGDLLSLGVTKTGVVVTGAANVTASMELA